MCIKLVNYKDYTEMHDQQNIKKYNVQITEPCHFLGISFPFRNQLLCVYWIKTLTMKVPLRQPEWVHTLLRCSQNNGEKWLFTFLCLFICLHGTTRVTLDGFLWNFILSVIKMSQPNSFGYKMKKITDIDTKNYVKLSHEILLESEKKSFIKNF